MKSFFVFDVESIGLYGEGFAVAGGVYLENGAAQWEFSCACPQEAAQGCGKDREWIQDNVPVLQIIHRNPKQLRSYFWAQWLGAKRRNNAQMAAECLFPVESGFVKTCISDDAERLSDAPYPFHEISSIMLAAGMDPMISYDRSESELPAHNPLADARQSARLLARALEAIKRKGELPEQPQKA